ncbi:MAG: ATP-binding cassette domain-containing protein [Brumimicrobium sp.]|nr:ATP-binding cassette domain-containing protein [Brumimicrobium sp.]
MIEVRKVNKTFGDLHVLKDFSAKFEAGRVNLIIGQSGSGKSVLTKCIVGLHEPDSGSILFDGRDFSKMNRKERKDIRKEIGMLFQDSALFDSLTIEENVMFPLKMFTNKTKAEMKKRADFCLERVNLGGRNKLLPAECSGGMKKRAAIARAISMNPKYLFCDEPNSGLDPSTSILIDNLIKEITEEYEMHTVVITHDMNSVIEIGEHIVFIYKGENWWSGTRDEILKTENKEIVDFVYASQFMKTLKGKLADNI